MNNPTETTEGRGWISEDGGRESIVVEILGSLKNPG